MVDEAPHDSAAVVTGFAGSVLTNPFTRDTLIIEENTFMPDDTLLSTAWFDVEQIVDAGNKPWLLRYYIRYCTASKGELPSGFHAHIF